MLKEIFKQPRTLRQTLKDRCDENLETAFFKNFNFSPDELRSVEHVLILRCGSSWHAGCIAASIFEKYGEIPAQVEIASIPFSIAAQLFAYYIAKEHDREIDFPRNLAKSVTVE
jgi:glucosamine 6-phosphate synthetase-like amidotransferase/phosphosugar isomerase protein